MGGPGMGGPPMGGPSMGRGPGMGSGNFGRPSDTGFPGANQNRMDHGMSNLGSQAPKRVLSNQKLDSSLTNALGKSGIKVPGGNLQTACAGFKNLGECVAAMHVAKNLNLSFSSLQNLMTGAHPESLGKAIRGLGGPNVKTRHELKKANKQTKRDLHAAAKAAAMTS